MAKLRLQVLMFWPKSFKNEVAELRQESPVLTPTIIWFGDSGEVQGVGEGFEGGGRFREDAWVQIHAQPRRGPCLALLRQNLVSKSTQQQLEEAEERGAGTCD